MDIGIPKEIKNHEYRVALTPEGARELIRAGHEVSVESGAGVGSGFDDDDYRAAGARIASSAADIWAAGLVVKVKEPQAEELPGLRNGQILFCYLHLAPAPALTHSLMASGVTAIAYETVSGADGSLPLLTPMSEIAGRLAPQMGALGLHKTHGGSGMLVSGMPGVPPAHVVIIGAGIVGINAARDGHRPRRARHPARPRCRQAFTRRTALRLAHRNPLFHAGGAGRQSSGPPIS